MVEPAYCRNCRKMINSADRFCPGCGADQMQVAQTLYAGQTLPPRPGQTFPVPYQPVTLNTAAALGWTVGAALCAFASLLFCPPGLGAAAIACGYQVKRAGAPTLAYVVMGVSAFMMIIGIVVGAIIGMNMFQHMGAHPIGTP